MDRKTLTITAIIAGLVFLMEATTYLRDKDVGTWVSFAAMIWLVTWGAVAFIRWAKRRIERRAVA